MKEPEIFVQWIRFKQLSMFIATPVFVSTPVLESLNHLLWLTC